MKLHLLTFLLSALLLGCGGAPVSPTAAAPTRVSTSIATQFASATSVSNTQPPASAVTTKPVPATPAPPTATGIPATATPAPTDQLPDLPGTRVGTQTTHLPTFINHSPPNSVLEFAPFENAGCPPDNSGQRICEPNSELGTLGCDEIVKPSNLLGGLKPRDPIALCFVVPYRRAEREELPRESYLYRSGGLLGRYARLVIWRDKRFQVIHSLAELKNAYAPIESSAEALAFALAATPLTAKYGLKYDPRYVYLADTLEDTFVKSDGDGYLVHLFYFQLFGCGAHLTVAIDLHMARDGTLTESAPQPQFKDPKMDGLCVD